MNKNKIVFLFGAGAAAPFIGNEKNKLTTEYITQSLLKESNWKEIISLLFDEKRKQKDDSILYLDPKNIIFMTDKIVQEINKKRNPNYYGFDYILHLLDKISLKLSRVLYDEIENIDEIFMDIIGTFQDKEKKNIFSGTNESGWRLVPYLAREIIISSILRLWNESGNILNIGMTNMENFLESILKSNRTINLYTLNYDPFMQKTVINLSGVSTGFINGIFDRKSFWDAENILAFMHGHAGLIPLGNENYFDMDYFMAKKRRLAGLFDIRVEYTFRYYDTGMKGTHFNTWLVSSLDKIDAFYKPPFSIYLHRFARNIIESEIIVIIGSSLSDLHLDPFLSNIIPVFDKKIIFVTYQSIDDFVKGFQFPRLGNDDLFVKLLVKSGAKITVRNNNIDNSIKEYLKGLSENIRKNGFGRLANNIVIFPNGTESFLKNSTILNKIESVF